MKKRYCIGFFASVFLVVCLLGVGYQLSYQYTMDKNAARLAREAQQNELEAESITTKGAATKNDGYYLCELHGYVVVYLYDKETIYEYTDILVEHLPDALQEELGDGKWIETPEELYGFLENYSS